MPRGQAPVMPCQVCFVVIYIAQMECQHCGAPTLRKLNKQFKESQEKEAK